MTQAQALRARLLKDKGVRLIVILAWDKPDTH